jgi:hypothetical protein
MPGRCARDVRDRNVAQTRDLLGNVPDPCGLVALAAIGHRREVRTVGFDQHAIERDAPCDILEIKRILERDDARKGDVKSEIERSLRDVPVGDVARATTENFFRLFGIAPDAL